LKTKKITKTTVSTPTLVASSTPQRTTSITKTRASPVVELQDDEALLDEVLANDSEGSDAAPATDEDEQTKDASLRQRRTNK
jgi:hypothetical protein